MWSLRLFLFSCELVLDDFICQILQGIVDDSKHPLHLRLIRNEVVSILIDTPLVFGLTWLELITIVEAVVTIVVLTVTRLEPVLIVIHGHMVGKGEFVALEIAISEMVVIRLLVWLGYPVVERSIIVLV